MGCVHSWASVNHPSLEHREWMKHSKQLKEQLRWEQKYANSNVWIRLREVILGHRLVVRKMYSRGSVKTVEPSQLVLLFRTETRTAKGEKLTHETETGQLFKTLQRKTLRMEGWTWIKAWHFMTLVFSIIFSTRREKWTFVYSEKDFSH